MGGRARMNAFLLAMRARRFLEQFRSASLSCARAPIYAHIDPDYLNANWASNVEKLWTPVNGDMADG